MSEATAVQKPDDAPVTEGDGVGQDELAQLLEEFDRANAPKAELEQSGDNVSQDGQVQDSELDRLIADLSQPSPDQQRITELTGQVDSLRAEEYRRGELQAF